MNDHQEPSTRHRPTRSTWNTRGFISQLLLLQGIVLTASGIVRYFSPRGREAHWVDWRVLALNKDEWSSVHMTSALVIVVLAIIHLAYNWRAMLRYVVVISGIARGKGTEVVLAVLVTAGLLAITIAEVPPANTLFVQSERLKDAYAASVESAPWPHAEIASIEMICNRFEIPINKALNALDGAGFPAENSTETLSEIARKHGTAPSRILAVISGHAGTGRQQTQPARCQDRYGQGPGKCR